MPDGGLSLQDQAQIAIKAVTGGDMDLFERLLTDPNSITIADQRTVAEKLGIKKGLLSAFVNTAADPTVWLAYWMSKRFPSSAWLRGTIPHRFVGGNNEFTGLSFITRPVEGFFRGTNIPRLVALAQYRQAEVMKVARRMFERFEARPNWADEMPIVSQLREGLDVPDAHPELRAIADGLKTDMDELWGFLKQSWKLRGGFDGEQITRVNARPMTPREAPQYIRDYLPHIPIVSDETLIDPSGIASLKKMAKSKRGQAVGLAGESILNVWTPDASDRLSSDFGRYQRFINNVGSELFNPNLFRRVRHNLNLTNGQDLLVTDLNYILQRYVNGVAKTYALNAPITDAERALVWRGAPTMPTNEPIIAQVINEGLDSTGAKYARRTRRIAGTNVTFDTVVPGTENAPMRTALRQLVRNLRGDASEDEILFGNMFSSVRNKLASWAGENRVTSPALARIDASINTFERNANYRKKMNGLASYFYTSTLGLNPWAAIQNLLQPFLTTGPAMGIGSLAAGYKVLGERLPKYVTEIGNQMRLLRANPNFTGPTDAIRRLNVGSERAFENVFPELSAHGIRIDPRLFDVDEKLLGIGQSGRASFSKRDDLAKFIMQPFTQSESANRIVSFYGAKAQLQKFVRTGEYELPAHPSGGAMTPSEIDKHLNFDAAAIARETQFTPGAGSRTVWQNMLPAPVWQFTSFYSRLLSFMADSTVKGAMSNRAMEDTRTFKILRERGLGALNPLAKDPESVALQQKLLSFGTGRNVGTLARIFLYSKILTNGFRDAIGIDLGNALGLDTPFQAMSSGGLFAPLPFPPAPNALFGLAAAATTRDIKRLGPLRLPYVGDVPIPKTLIPGGVAITRAVRAVQQFSPDLGGFVDDDERLMYHAGVPEMYLAALGVPLDKQRRSREILARVNANRTAVRDFRRKYAVAGMNMDFAQQQALQQAYGEKFKDMPPLNVSAEDISRYREQASLTQVQRMIRTMGETGKFMERDLQEYEPELVSGP